MAGFRKKRNLPLAIFLLCGSLLVAAAVGLTAIASVSAGSSTSPSTGIEPQSGDVSNESCLVCHSKPDMRLTFPNGDELSTIIDADAFTVSVHGNQNLQCVDCHTDIKGYPHPQLEAQSKNDYKDQYTQTCEKCHEREAQDYNDSLHSKAVASGDVNAPTCTDCHNPHTQGKVTDDNGKLLPSERVNIPQQCANCHNNIYNEYAQSVHGEGILLKMNTDVATCTDCHGVHKIQDPKSANYREKSAEMCSNCHTNKEIMDKYGLSTNVLNSYVADFHGTTVELFEPSSPDDISNKPVCYDCHGVHDIVKVTDPVKGLEVRQNLLKTCKKCHPDATDNFPDSWLSHYDPSPTKWPLVYYVNLFYKIIIPTVIGGMALFVITDFIRRRIDAGKNRPTEKGGEETKEVKK